MHKELLIIRCGEKYIRYRERKYMPCLFDKASVFPVENSEAVRYHLDRVRKAGFDNACIKKLVIREEDWSG